jgi:cysteine desulfurase/selenocysteine lyase
MESIRHQFPIFKHHPNFVYLDNAATTHKPYSVIQAEIDFYEQYNANVHRGIYPIAAKATAAYEAVREKVKHFLNAAKPSEIIFTSGTTEGVNLVAQAYLSDILNENDEVMISAMEHHSNLIPWQQVCFKKGAKLVVIPFSTEGVLDFDFFIKNLNKNTKFVAVNHISNTLGTVNPIEKIIEAAHAQGISVLIDAAQSATTHILDVQKLGVDFLVFSGHKIFGPTGTGVLYAKEKYLKQMSPYKFGGEMIRDVTFARTVFAPPPQKFEAGTPNIAGVIGLGAAIDFLNEISQNTIQTHTQNLLKYATEQLLNIDVLEIIGNAPKKSAIISFQLRGVHPHDMATILGEQNICVRTGHHCTQPIMDFYDIPATCRASFSIYNTFEDVDRLVGGILQVRKIFNRSF